MVDNYNDDVASGQQSQAALCGSSSAPGCSAVGIRQVWIGELPPEVGPEGTRLVVLLENKRWLSVLLDQPMDNIELAKRLRNLADGITQNPSRQGTPHKRRPLDGVVQPEDSK